jgi:hypothetical protein
MVRDEQQRPTVARRSAVCALGAALALMACREPSAPEARDLVRSVQKDVARGDLQRLWHFFAFLGTAGTVYGWPPAQNQALQIRRDGATENINGFVIEEVLVAPNGIGKPFVRRSIVGWPTTQDFALLAYSESNSGTLSATSDDSEPHTPDVGLFLQIPDDTLRSWVHLSGYVAIGDAVIDKECGNSKGLPRVPYSPERVQCHFALFEVAVRGELLTLADSRNRLMRSFQRRHQLEIGRQRLPGIRFVTTCSEDTNTDAYSDFDCQNPIRFWRDNSQYAPSLGIDFAKLKNLGGIFAQFERRSDGKHVYCEYDIAPDGTLCRPTPARWTIHTPDGTLIESGSRNAEGIAIPDRDVEAWIVQPGIPPDLRRLKVVYPGGTADPYRVFVLTVEMGDPLPNAP